MFKQKQCADCYHYFENDADQEKGVCKLNPPVPFPVQTLDALQQPQMTIMAVPVHVTAQDWCGCWMSRQMELEYQETAN